MTDVRTTDRHYRRGAIMGLTMAEAFVLICFALLLLFAFWQWETEKQNTPDVQAFKEMTQEQRRTVLTSVEDGSIDAFVTLKEKGVDFATPASVENPKEMWRFIDKGELLRLTDAAASLPEDVQRSLANLVEADKAENLLKEMAILEDLVKAGQSLDSLPDKLREAEIAQKRLQEMAVIEELVQSGLTLEEISEKVKEAERAQKRLEEMAVIQDLIDSGLSLDDILEKVREAEALEGISGKIRAAESQEADLVGALRSQLGGIVSEVGGHIDDTGAIILPDRVLFDQGKSTITPSLDKFMQSTCEPWLATLHNSGIDLAEVKIEGHASSEWRGGASPQIAYLGNLNLSQQRSQSVLRTCLKYVGDPELLEWARKHLIAVGYSSVRPILGPDGQEDEVASRRVVFSVTPNRQSLIDEIQTDAGIAGYDRDLFGSWTDLDGDCRNTRQEILQASSTGNVSFDVNNCTVTRGRWLDPYTFNVFIDPRDVEVDHLVPLKWAWDRGAASWPAQKREDFANDEVNLFVVDGAVNREKGAKGPLDWLPPFERFQCEYITRFQRVVQKYDLQPSEKEQADMNALSTQLCE